jgi:hypothetical protein
VTHRFAVAGEVPPCLVLPPLNPTEGLRRERARERAMTRMISESQWGNVAKVAVVMALTGCGGGGGGDRPAAMRPFALEFVATADGRPVGCTDTLTDLGPDRLHTAGISDLRFYIGNVRFFDRTGNPVDVVLDANEFQLERESGFVGLIDLTSNTEGTCASNAIAFAEGTARTNDSITGTTRVDDVASVSFDVGVPHALMRR